MVRHVCTEEGYNPSVIREPVTECSKSAFLWALLLGESFLGNSLIWQPRLSRVTDVRM